MVFVNVLVMIAGVLAVFTGVSVIIVYIDNVHFSLVQKCLKEAVHLSFINACFSRILCNFYNVCKCSFYNVCKCLLLNYGSAQDVVIIVIHTLNTDHFFGHHN